MVCSVANMDQLERSHRGLVLRVPSHQRPRSLRLPFFCICRDEFAGLSWTFDRLTVNHRHCRDPGLWLFYPCSLVQPWQAGCSGASIAWPAPLERVERSGELARAVASVSVPALVPGALVRSSPSAAPARAAVSVCVAAFVLAPPAHFSPYAAPVHAVASACVAPFVPVSLAQVPPSAAPARAGATVCASVFVPVALARVFPSVALVHAAASAQRSGPWLSSVAGSAESRLHAADSGSPGSGSKFVALPCAGSVLRNTVVGSSARVPPSGPNSGSTGPIRCVATTSFAPSDRPSAAPRRRSSHGNTTAVGGNNAPGCAARTVARIRDPLLARGRCTKCSHTNCRAGRPSMPRRKRSNSSLRPDHSKRGSPVPGPFAGKSACRCRC